MAYEYRMGLALQDIANLDTPNFVTIARKHKLIPSILSRRACGVTRLVRDFTQFEKKYLIDIQEAELLHQIS